MTPTPDIRRLTADDVPRLAGPVERARAAGEFKASSDADAQFFLKSVALDPRIVTAAFDDAELVGFSLYESEGFVRAATRERWARPVPRSATAIRGPEPVC